MASSRFLNERGQNMAIHVTLNPYGHPPVDGEPDIVLLEVCRAGNENSWRLTLEEAKQLTGLLCKTIDFDTEGG